MCLFPQFQTFMVTKSKKNPPRSCKCHTTGFNRPRYYHKKFKQNILSHTLHNRIDLCLRFIKLKEFLIYYDQRPRY